MRKTVVKTGEEILPILKKIRKSQLYRRHDGAARWFFEDILKKRMDPKYVVLGLTEENEKPLSWVLFILPNKNTWFSMYKQRGKPIVIWRYTKPTLRNQGMYFSLRQKCVSFSVKKGFLKENSI